MNVQLFNVSRVIAFNVPEFITLALLVDGMGSIFALLCGYCFSDFIGKHKFFQSNARNAV